MIVLTCPSHPTGRPAMDEPSPELLPTPERAPSGRAFEAVATRLREELAAGSYAVGERLPSERLLSQDYGVSRNTLREALRSLEEAGLIRLQKGATGGAFVTGTSHGAISSGFADLFRFGAVSPGELTQARIWLEGVVVREACARTTAEDLLELEANVDAAAATADFRRCAELNLDFHRILARMTGNPVVVAVMNGLLDVMERFVEQLGRWENRDVIPSRRRFLRHLAARECDDAVVEMEAGLLELHALYLSRLPQAGQTASGAGVEGVGRT